MDDCCILLKLMAILGDLRSVIIAVSIRIFGIYNKLADPRIRRWISLSLMQQLRHL